MPFFYFTPKATINWQEELITFDSLELEKKVEKIINILCKHLSLRRDQYRNQYTPLEFFTVLLVQQQLCEIPATEKPNIASLTNKVSESPKNYLELFQYIFGKTIYEYHRTIHMEFAKWLLETQKLSVSEVGKQLGFKTRNSFAQAFKVHYMSNPKIFKPRSIWTY
jgi:AraC-like DNA-binding protein